jgi:hypothetical protein
VIVPWTKFVHKEKNTDFKIITESGMEYFLVTENKLKNNIADYCWSRVKVQGTIDLNLMTLKVDRIHIDDRELEMNFYSENLMQAKQEPYLTYEPAREV